MLKWEGSARCLLIGGIGRTPLSRVYPDLANKPTQLTAGGPLTGAVYPLRVILRAFLIPLAKELGVAERSLYAVSVFFDEAGEYAGFENTSLLTQQQGKRITVQGLGLKTPILAVGDGMTDSEMKPVVTNFAAYTGFTRRKPVIERADFVVESFAELRNLILK